MSSIPDPVTQALVERTPYNYDALHCFLATAAAAGVTAENATHMVEACVATGGNISPYELLGRYQR